MIGFLGERCLICMVALRLSSCGTWAELPCSLWDLSSLARG